MKKTYADDAEYIEAMMKRFKLVDMRLQYQDLILEAEASPAFLLCPSCRCTLVNSSHRPSKRCLLILPYSAII